MKIVDYKKLAKSPADTLFATINKMNELGEVLVMGIYPDGRRFIYSPLADCSGAGNREIEFDDNTFSRTGSFVVFENAEIQGMIDKFSGILNFESQHKSVTLMKVPEGLTQDVIDSHLTPIYPVVQQCSARNFVSPDLVPPREVLIDDAITIMTAPLAMGAHFNLLGIGQTESLLETGILDTTDAIDPNIALQRVYLHLETLGKPDEVVMVDLIATPLAQAHFASQGGYREMAVNFVAGLDLPAQIPTIDGSLSKIMSKSVTVRVAITGTINLELGDTRFVAQRVESFQLNDELVRVKAVGYDLKACRVNHNRMRRAA